MANTQYIRNRRNTPAQTSRPAAKEQQPSRLFSGLSGLVTVFGNDYTTHAGAHFKKYKASISGKDQQGNYRNAYMDLRFPRDNDPELEGRFVINVEDAFVTAVLGRNGDNVPCVYVAGYQIVED